jgi:hypothetical protein
MANEQNLKPFKKGQSGNTRGRPKKIFSAISFELKAKGYEPAKPENVREIFEFLLALPLEEVAEIAGRKNEPDNGYPALLRIIASELLGKRGFQIVNAMLDRAHGKALEKRDIQKEIVLSQYTLPDGTTINL